MHLLSVVALDENRCGLDRLDSLAVRGLSDRLLSRLPSVRTRKKFHYIRHVLFMFCIGFGEDGVMINKWLIYMIMHFTINLPLL